MVYYAVVSGNIKESKAVLGGDISTQGGIHPTGVVEISENGTYNVESYAYADVDVEGITPTGTKEISITANGTTSEDVTDYAEVEISTNVPNSYSAEDEGKVVSEGALVSQTSTTYTANGTYNTTLKNSVTVNVSGGSTPTLQTKSVSYTPTESQQTEQVTADQGYDALQEVDVTVGPIPPQYIIPTGTKSITSNENGIDVTSYADVNVNVPNSYSAGDEGKVVDDGALVAQTSVTKTANGTYDTTTNNEVVISVPASAVDSGTKSITSNGNNQDVVGYATVDVNVPNSYTAGDEGKVVSSGALVAQTSRTITANGTYGTTLNDEVVVNVSGGHDYLQDKAEGTLTTYSNDNITTLASNAFQGFTTLQSLYLPNVTAMTGNSFFTGCGFTKFALPRFTGDIENATWQGCANLTTLDLAATMLKGTAIYNSQMFDTLILRSTSLVGMNHINVLGNTKFKNNGAGGTIYIPKVLYDHLGDGTASDYKAATNWSTYDGYGTITWAKIEGSYYETHYGDDTLIE